ncbi:MAG: AAA family ATPase [archaeon]
MIIRSLRMRNIRSYIDEAISFPEGTVLLSGDIGSGKTTILLAIEFAVFGIMKGVLSGGALLRHGANSGSVELSLRIGEQEVLIKRTLKRTALGVAQDSGSIMVNGKPFEGTPQEIKSKVLELIGYPESLLNKSKSLIFRYTVFTPQEEMKRILFETKDERLDILRHLFNIDKYKRIRDNAGLYSRELRSRINALQGKLEALPAKRNELKAYDSEIEIIKSSLQEQESILKKSKTEVETANRAYELLQKELEHMHRIEREFAVKKSEQLSLAKQLERKEAEIARTGKAIEESLKLLEGFDISRAEDIRQKTLEKKQELRAIEQKLSELTYKRSEFATRKKAAEELLKKISSLDECPTCLQKVTQEHLDRIHSKEQVLIKACETNIEKIDEIDKRFSGRKESINSELDLFSKGEREIEAKKARFESLDEKRSQKAQMEHELIELRESLTKTNKEVAALAAAQDQNKDKRESAEKAKKELDRQKEGSYLIEKVIVERKTKLETISSVMQRLKNEIKSLEHDEAGLNHLRDNRGWIEDRFIPLADLLEKSILARIHGEFNSFFQEWFDILLEEETVSVRLDDYFSPVIEQNGYETWLENLSGGERTSIALAYRLALNKVINDFLNSIRTKGLIILDEPTEGFSSEQLEKVREVLNQANMKQTIIVSHEAKMESFVDHIIRISKQGHISKVANACQP